MMVCPPSIVFKSIQSILLIFIWLLIQVEVIADSKIIVSEIYYNPNGPDEAREFIEIKNVGNLAEDISGWQLHVRGDGTAHAGRRPARNRSGHLG